LSFFLQAQLSKHVSENLLALGLGRSFYCDHLLEARRLEQLGWQARAFCPVPARAHHLVTPCDQTIDRLHQRVAYKASFRVEIRTAVRIKQGQNVQIVNEKEESVVSIRNSDIGWEQLHQKIIFSCPA
jgi:hypothetical protein